MSETNAPSLSVEAVRAILREPDRWPELSKEQTLMVLFMASSLYGERQDSSMVEALSAFIRFADDRTTEAERADLVYRMVEHVDRGKSGASALLPFIFVDKGIGPVATAVLMPRDNQGERAASIRVRI